MYEKIIDPIERKLFYEKNNKLLKIIEKKYELESENEVNIRIKKILNYIENTNNDKIIIITHGGFIVKLLKLLLNTHCKILGDMSNGYNCHITMLIYNNKNYKLVTLPNTKHFSLYKK